MDSEAVFHAPLILRGLCYFAGMAVFLCEILWLVRMASGRGHDLSLRANVSLWLIRVLGGAVLASLLFMLMHWDDLPSKAIMLPELSILCLIAAFYLLMFRKSGRPTPRRILQELAKTLGVLLFCLMGWALSFVMGWLLFQALPPASAIFILGLIWNAVPVLLFLRAKRAGHTADLQFSDMLLPILLAYMLLMLPDATEHIANSQKMHKMMHPSPPLVRA